MHRRFYYRVRKAVPIINIIYDNNYMDTFYFIRIVTNILYTANTLVKQSLREMSNLIKK